MNKLQNMFEQYERSELMRLAQDYDELWHAFNKLVQATAMLELGDKEGGPIEVVDNILIGIDNQRKEIALLKRYNSDMEDTLKKAATLLRVSTADEILTSLGCLMGELRKPNTTPVRSTVKYMRCDQCQRETYMDTPRDETSCRGPEGCGGTLKTIKDPKGKV